MTILSLFGISKISEHDCIVERLKGGLDVNTVDIGGRTLLMEAVIKNDCDLVRILLDWNADVTVCDNRNWTALHFAVQAEDEESIKLLLKYGAEIDAQDDYGNTPLTRAILGFRGTGEVVKLLVANGADINLVNNSGLSALGIASTISNYDVVQFLQ